MPQSSAMPDPPQCEGAAGPSHLETREAISLHPKTPAQPLAPGLYLVATPIGNLNDITLRALHVLRSVDRIACEDTRQTQKLLNHFQIVVPTISCHEHNELTRAAELVQVIKRGSAELRWFRTQGCRASAIRAAGLWRRRSKQACRSSPFPARMRPSAPWSPRACRLRNSRSWDSCLKKVRRAQNPARETGC